MGELVRKSQYVINKQDVLTTWTLFSCYTYYSITAEEGPCGQSKRSVHSLIIIICR